MGWGRMLLLGNWGQQMDIEDQRGQIEQLRHEIGRIRAGADRQDLGERVQQLESELDEMRLYLAALMRHLAERRSLDRNEFARLIQAIDHEDGAADGTYRGPIAL